MELIKPQDIFALSIGDIITKRNLFDLIQFSKVESSSSWAGIEYAIGNTPQQGINWIGELPMLKGVIIKTRPGSYIQDGWVDDKHIIYQYSFKARNGEISFKEKANDVLIKQPQHNYPIFLFSEIKSSWYFEGTFLVTEIEDKFVVLNRSNMNSIEPHSNVDEIIYSEGDKRYVTHLMVERNKDVVSALKNSTNWVCEICDLNFMELYGVPYIEAHHKIPISSYTSKYIVKQDDLALLCPNCHKAVHIHMKIKDQPYAVIKSILQLKNN